MGYVGIQTQQARNNTRSIMLLLMFPLLMLAMTWVVVAVFVYFTTSADGYTPFDLHLVNQLFLEAAPWVIGVVLLWFVIAYFYHTSIIKAATKAKPLERRDNMRVYNITENLCMGVGMQMPQLYIVDDPQLNAFASGINDSTYAVTLTTGIINRLDDKELAGVIGHELTHIRNRDTRVLITTIVFVGILSTLMTLAWRMMLTLPNTRSSRDDKGKGAGMIVLFAAAVVLSIGYLFTSITRFAVSRKREYMADAGGSELCGDPLALASALRKISGDPGLQNCSSDVAQLFIAAPLKGKRKKSSWWSNLWATHPDINRRIAILEQF